MSDPKTARELALEQELEAMKEELKRAKLLGLFQSVELTVTQSAPSAVTDEQRETLRAYHEKRFATLTDAAPDDRLEGIRKFAALVRSALAARMISADEATAWYTRLEPLLEAP